MEELQIVSVTATQEVISEIVNLRIEGVASSEPIVVDNPADVLDSSLNPSDLVSGFEMIKVIFETGTAVITFGTALSTILKNRKTKVKVSTSEKNREGKVVDDKSSDEEILEALLK